MSKWEEKRTLLQTLINEYEMDAFAHPQGF